MIYFTADLHLGHENIMHLCNRPFNNIEEHPYCVMARSILEKAGMK